jgi:hypothetical protein
MINLLHFNVLQINWTLRHLTLFFSRGKRRISDSLDYHWIPWITMGFPGFPLDSQAREKRWTPGIPNPIQILGIQRESRESRESWESRKSIGNSGNPRNLSNPVNMGSAVSVSYLSIIPKYGVLVILLWYASFVILFLWKLQVNTNPRRKGFAV